MYLTKKIVHVVFVLFLRIGYLTKVYYTLLCLLIWKSSNSVILLFRGDQLMGSETFARLRWIAANRSLTLALHKMLHFVHFKYVFDCYF
jgi:hypothetical protein